MSLPVHSPVQKKISLSGENSNNFETSGIRIVEEQSTKNPSVRGYHNKEKEKRNSLSKKFSDDLETVKETKKIVKVKNLIDAEFIDGYNPQIQDNTIHPKLKFFVDTESVSESDRDLSSASFSSSENVQETNNK